MIRASAGLHLPIGDIFKPIVPVQVVGLIFVFATSWWLGRREEKRLGLTSASNLDVVVERKLSDAELALRRPKNFWFNIILTVIVLGTMVVMGEKVPPALMFMAGTCIALLVNYPDVDMQRARVDAHAKAALMGQMTTGFPVSPLTPATFLVVIASSGENRSEFSVRL